MFCLWYKGICFTHTTLTCYRFTILCTAQQFPRQASEFRQFTTPMLPSAPYALWLNSGAKTVWSVSHVECNETELQIFLGGMNKTWNSKGILFCVWQFDISYAGVRSKLIECFSCKDSLTSTTNLWYFQHILNSSRFHKNVSCIMVSPKVLRSYPELTSLVYEHEQRDRYAYWRTFRIGTKSPYGLLFFWGGKRR